MVHFHNQFSAAAGIRVAHQHGVPAAYTVHNGTWCRTQDCESSLQRFKFLLELRAMREADVVVCVSRAVAENVVRYLGVTPERVAVIPNGVGDEWFGDVDVSESMRRRYKPNGEALVLNVARMAPYKNQMALALAIPLVIAAVPDARFLFVGPVSDAVYARKVERVLAKAAVSGQVAFTGSVCGTELRELYALSGVCVLCSSAEAHPIALLEAMACGKPVVGSDIGPIRETIADGGITVPVFDHKALAEAITSLLRNDAARRKMGQRAAQRSHDYRWGGIAGRTVEVYNHVRAG